MPDIFTQSHEKKAIPEENKKQSSLGNGAIESKTLPPEPIAQPPQPLETSKEIAPTATQKEVQLPNTQPTDSASRAKILPSPLGFFGHYKENPTGIHFANQENDEQILLFLRKHFITNLPWLLITTILIVLPFLLFFLFTLTGFTFFSIPPQLVIILLLFYLLIVMNYALLNFINWFYDVGIVTKKRLLDLDADNILKHHLAETEIEGVVDVSYAQQGFFQSFFNYGNVHIQTEAIKANFEYIASPNPSLVSDIISDLKALKTNEEKKHA